MREALWTPEGWAAYGMAATAFLAGVFIGWLIWGGRAFRAPSGASEAPPQIDDLKSQIETAREVLNDSDAETRTISEQLQQVDVSIKSAHARLKQILMMIRRAPDQ